MTKTTKQESNPQMKETFATRNKQPDRIKVEKSNLALTQHEIQILKDALSANRHFLREERAGWQALLKKDETEQTYDEREKRNLKKSIEISDHQVIEISSLIQEVNGQLLGL